MVSLANGLNLLTVVSDTIFNTSVATTASALHMPKTFHKVWYAGLLHEMQSYGKSGMDFSLIMLFLGNRRFQVLLTRQSMQEYPINTGYAQGSSTFPTID